MKLFNVDTLEEAREKLKNAFPEHLLITEKIDVFNSVGRIVAEDIVSKVNVPDFMRSTVDGYAVLSRDTQGASESLPVFLKIIDEIEMGKEAEIAIHSGECAYVPTGGMLPPNADAMVMIEYCEFFNENQTAVYDAVSDGRNVIHVGEDIMQGDLFIRKGTKIRAQELGALTAAGVVQVKVYCPLKVYIISTGDELTPPGEELKEGKIYDINSYTISAMAASKDFDVVGYKVVVDDEGLLRETVKNAMQCCDIVIISGGTSQGQKDITYDIMENLSDPGVFTHGLALKPGKPTILGFDKKTSTFLVGLPGHPVAAMIVFELIISNVVHSLMGIKDQLCIYAQMETNYSCDAGKANCIPVELVDEQNGYTARVIYGKSGLVTTLTRSHGFVLTQENQEGLKKGEIVRVHLF